VGVCYAAVGITDPTAKSEIICFEVRKIFSRTECTEDSNCMSLTH
jgi:hypothetical protein